MTMHTEELKKLRGTHDQTMRCGIITAMFGTARRDGQTPTEQFLEWIIMWSEEAHLYRRIEQPKE
jgi:hypothetical protein